MFGRPRSSDDIRRSALKMAERKREAGCVPCAEAYVALASQPDAARRRLLARAFIGAGALSVASLADPAGVLLAHRDDQPKLEALSSDRTYHAFHGLGDRPAVRLLDARLPGEAELKGYEVRGSGVLLTRSHDPGHLVLIQAHEHFEAALFDRTRAFRVRHGSVVRDDHLEQVLHDVREHHTSLPHGVASLIGPKQALAACPACPALLEPAPSERPPADQAARRAALWPLGRP